MGFSRAITIRRIRGTGILLAGAACLSVAHAQWAPSGALAAVKVVRDCDQTAGDVMATRLDPPTIYVCPLVVREVRRKHPGAETFFLVHEYGHIAQDTASETLADCWAAHALAGVPNGRRAIDAAVALFRQRGEGAGGRYGSPAERARRIEDCATP